MRIALVGCGAQGLAYAAAASELGLDVALCADPRAVAAKQAAALCRAKPSTNCDKTLVCDDIDAVLLCAPAVSRLAQLRRAASHGKHVLCAAPLGHSLAPARKALEAVRTASVSLYVAHDGRAAPEEFTLLCQLDQGSIGGAGFVRIHRSGPAAKGAHAIECLLPRDLDGLFRRFGASPRIYAQTLHRPGLSHASLTLAFPAGPIVQWIATLGAPARTLLEMCGTAGMIQFSTDDTVLQVTPAPGTRAAPPDRSSPIAHGLPARHLAHFLATIEKPTAEATCDHELAIVRGVEAALRSARTGAEVRLP